MFKFFKNKIWPLALQLLNFDRINIILENFLDGPKNLRYRTRYHFSSEKHSDKG